VLLVKEGQSVTQGEKIAEMGDTDSDRVMLHFELRYEGRSIDPSRALPAR
jgi:lipoprotein YgeR